MGDLPQLLAKSTGRGYLVAPAGYGKTHLIAAAVGRAVTRQLVLTHTYAGVNALRRKMRDLSVPRRACRVDTIASWALRLCLSYTGSSAWSVERPVGQQWEQLYRACAALLDQSFIRRILRASFGGLYVDEYQDCSAAQHELVLALSRDLPCRILGDPLQAIFDFDGQSPVDWNRDVTAGFAPIGTLETPHRWILAGRPYLGAWLQAVRLALEEGRTIDLTQAIEGVTLREVADENGLVITQGNTCRYFACDRHHSAVAIHKGHQQYKAKCHRLAKSIGGRFSSIEEIEGKHLFSFVNQIERETRGGRRLKRLIAFAESCMTAVQVNLPAATSRGEPVQIRRNTKNPTVAAAANAFLGQPSSLNMAAFLDALKALPDVEVSRSDLLNRMAGVLKKHVLRPDFTLREAADRYHSEFRHKGRPVGRRLIGTTLLLKGLEFDHAIVLDAASLSRKELYVALTRGARSLTIISTESRLDPAD
jgi:DNA helicase-2/ATP-dependent DNA helicase PcrA